jgi:hypothetical protein
MYFQSRRRSSGNRGRVSGIRNRRRLRSAAGSNIDMQEPIVVEDHVGDESKTFKVI